MTNQTKVTFFFHFRPNKLSLKFLTVQTVSAVVTYCWYLQEGSNVQLATSSCIAIAFEESSDEGSDTTVFRAWNNVNTSLLMIRQHRQSIWEAPM